MSGAAAGTRTAACARSAPTRTAPHPSHPRSYVDAERCLVFTDFVLWCSMVRWSCWNTTGLLYWVEARSYCYAEGKWGECACRAQARPCER